MGLDNQQKDYIKEVIINCLRTKFKTTSQKAIICHFITAYLARIEWHCIHLFNR